MSPVSLDTFVPIYFTTGNSSAPDGLTTGVITNLLEAPSSVDVSSYLSSFDDITSSFPSLAAMNPVFTNSQSASALSQSIELPAGSTYPYLILDSKGRISPSSAPNDMSNVINNLSVFTGKDVLSLLDIRNSPNNGLQNVSAYYLNSTIGPKKYTCVQYVVSVYGFVDVVFNIRAIVTLDMQILVSYTSIDTTQNPNSISITFPSLSYGWESEPIPNIGISLGELKQKAWVFYLDPRTEAQVIGYGATAANLFDYKGDIYGSISKLVGLGFSRTAIVEQLVNTGKLGVDKLVQYYGTLTGGNAIGDKPFQLRQDGVSLAKFVAYYTGNLPSGSTNVYVLATILNYPSGPAYTITDFQNTYSGNDFHAKAIEAGFSIATIMGADSGAMPSLVRLGAHINDVDAYYNDNYASLKATYPSSIQYFYVVGYTVNQIMNKYSQITALTLYNAGVTFGDFIQSTAFSGQLQTARSAGYSAQVIHSYYGYLQNVFAAGFGLLDLYTKDDVAKTITKKFEFFETTVSTYVSIEVAYEFSSPIFGKSTAFLERTRFAFADVVAIQQQYNLDKVSISYAIQGNGNVFSQALKTLYTFREIYAYQSNWEHVFQSGNTMSELIAANIGLSATNYVNLPGFTASQDPK